MGKIQFNPFTGTFDYNDVTTTAIGGTVTGATEGSVLFVGTGGVLAQDNTNFFWEDTNNRLGLGINSGFTAKLNLQTTAVDELGLYIKTMAGQTGDFISLNDSSDNNFFKINKSGQVFLWPGNVVGSECTLIPAFYNTLTPLFLSGNILADDTIGIVSSFIDISTITYDHTLLATSTFTNLHTIKNEPGSGALGILYSATFYDQSVYVADTDSIGTGYVGFWAAPSWGAINGGTFAVTGYGFWSYPGGVDNVNTFCPNYFHFRADSMGGTDESGMYLQGSNFNYAFYSQSGKVEHQSQDPTAVLMTLKVSAGQTADMLNVLGSGDNLLFGVSSSGITTAPNFISNVAIGTAPYATTSTTLNTNLNADLLDSQEGSYYLDSANFTGTNWTDLTDSGATTLHKHDHGGLDGLADDDHSQYIFNAPTSSTRNVIQPTVATYIPLTIKGAAAQSVNLLDIVNSTDTKLLIVGSSGRVGIGTITGGAQTESQALLHITNSGFQTPSVTSGETLLILQSDSSSTNGPIIQLLAGNANTATGIYMGSAANGRNRGGLLYNQSTDFFSIFASASSVMGLKIGKMMIGSNADPSFAISLDTSLASPTIAQERKPSTKLTANTLTVQAQGAFLTGSNKTGGELRLSGGISTGNQASFVSFYTATAAGSGTADNTPTEKIRIDGTGNLGIGLTTLTAYLHIKAGTATTSTAPLKFTTGTLLGTAEAGAVEFVTDDFYATITTGAARKKFILDDGTALTSGRIPFVTTNGRLIDDSDLTFAIDTLTATKIVGTTSIKVGTAAGYISSDGSTGATGTFTTVDLKTVTVKDGIITSIV